MQSPTQFADLAGHFLHGLCIILFYGQFQKNPRLLQVFFQTMKGVDPQTQERPFLQNGGGGIRGVPKPIPGYFRLDFLESFFLSGQVKDTP
jgi:hypothetical protein